MKRRFAGLVAALGIASCAPNGSSSGYGGNCPTVNASCPSSPPSYAATIAPIVNMNCIPCHSPTGDASDKPLGQYAGLYKYRTTSLSTVLTCKMPLVPLSDKKLFVEWLACGAPDN